ncbi:MAG: peptide chain release factor N(5)-glutamine methyltransferase [Micropepsaceae bacterium]
MTQKRLREAAARLAAAGIDQPLREARILLDEIPDRFDEAVERRIRREPVAYILGRWEFWSLDFEVTPAVLIPRPDTETIVETALKELKHNPPKRILDLGTGSGCLLISLLTEWPDATGVGIDISPDALAVASRNADRLGVASRAKFVQCDFGELSDDRYDLVVSNPPYIADAVMQTLEPDVREYEPHLALKGGPDGLGPLERIAIALHDCLHPGALALIEIGYDQGGPATSTLRKRGLDVIGVVQDLGHNDRVIAARLPSRQK